MLNKESAILIVVDVQEKLAGLMSQKEGLFKGLERMVKGFEILGLPIICLEQVPDKLGETILQVAAAISDFKPISKSSFSCMGSTQFINALEKTGRKQVILVGIEAHICVYQSATHLLENDYEVTVISDAVSSRQDSNKSIALDRMSHLGASISSVEMSLFELLESADAPNFRSIASLIK